MSKFRVSVDPGWLVMEVDVGDIHDNEEEQEEEARYLAYEHWNSLLNKKSAYGKVVADGWQGVTEVRKLDEATA